jgi:ferrous iron transport protein A
MVLASTGETMTVLNLTQLPAGKSGEIVEVTGSPAGVARLQELGFQSGRMIEMISPGATCIVRLDHCKLCVRPCGACVVVKAL